MPISMFPISSLLFLFPFDSSVIIADSRINIAFFLWPRAPLIWSQYLSIIFSKPRISFSSLKYWLHHFIIVNFIWWLILFWNTEFYIILSTYTVALSRHLDSHTEASHSPLDWRYWQASTYFPIRQSSWIPSHSLPSDIKFVATSLVVLLLPSSSIKQI